MGREKNHEFFEASGPPLLARQRYYSVSSFVRRKPLLQGSALSHTPRFLISTHILPITGEERDINISRMLQPLPRPLQHEITNHHCNKRNVWKHLRERALTCSGHFILPFCCFQTPSETLEFFSSLRKWPVHWGLLTLPNTLGLTYFTSVFQSAYWTKYHRLCFELRCLVHVLYAFVGIFDVRCQF